MGIPSLFADCVKFIKEYDARLRANVVEKFSQPSICFAQIATDQRIVTNHKKRKAKSFGNTLCIGGLSVSRGAREQHTMAWLKAVSSQNVSSDMFFYKLPTTLSCRQREQKVVQPSVRIEFDNRLTSGRPPD